MQIESNGPFYGEEEESQTGSRLPRKTSPGLNFSMAEAPDEMIIHQSHRLHVGITDGTADKVESSPFEVFADRI